MKATRRLVRIALCTGFAYTMGHVLHDVSVYPAQFGDFRPVVGAVSALLAGVSVLFACKEVIALLQTLFPPRDSDFSRGYAWAMNEITNKTMTVDEIEARIDNPFDKNDFERGAQEAIWTHYTRF